MSIKPISSLTVLAALSTAAAVHGQTPTVLRVDASAPAGGNGATWGTAFRDLQDALAIAKVDSNPAKVYEIRVAQGVYKPDRGTHNRAMTFLVASGMSMYGGYGGLAAADPDLRDPSQFVSVLSGDLNGDDGAGFVNRGDNSYGVLRMEPYLSEPLTVDGFTISGGNSDNANAGGGVFVRGDLVQTAHVTGCVVKGNYALRGGGIASFAYLRIDRCIIESNVGTSNGGGIWARTVHITNSSVKGNSSTSGGGLCVDTLVAENVLIADNNQIGARIDERGTLTNCIIAGNVNSGAGGGIVSAASELRLIACLVAHNIAESGGGIAMSAGTLSANHCTLVGNWVWGSGAAVTIRGLSSITNSIVARNSSPLGSVATISNGSLAIHRSLLHGGTNGFSPIGLVAYDTTNINADPRFANVVGTSTDPTAWRDKDYRLLASSLAVDAADSAFAPSVALDVAGNPRFTDILVAPNTGLGSVTYLDLGPYETQPACRVDFDGSGVAAIDDVFVYINRWLVGDPITDFDGAPGISIDDLFMFLSAWLRGC